MKILCFAYIFSILAWILSDCVLIPARREKKVLISTISSAILNVILNVILIPFWNEIAAALSTVLAEMCMLIVNYYSSRDIVRNIFISKKFLKNFITSVIGCIGIVLVCLFCNISLHSMIIKTIASVLLSMIIYGGCLLIFHNETALQIMEYIKSRTKKA